MTVSGKYFGGHDGAADNTNGLVEIRLGSLTGPVLARAAPSTTGDRAFSVPVTIPAGAAAGDNFLAATQKRANGTPVYGTPARQAFTVLASPASAPGGGSTGAATNNVASTVPRSVAETLTLAQARLAAKMRVKRSTPGAKSIRANCSRRSRTSATCRVKWTSNGKSRSKRLVVKSEASSSAW